MAAAVVAEVAVETGALHIVSREFRLYVGLSRDGSYLHVVSPRIVDVTDIDGNVIHPAGELACTCAGGTFHGDCYRRREAVHFEQVETEGEPSWLTTAAPGELVEAYGK